MTFRYREDREDEGGMDAGQLRLKKVRSTAPPRGVFSSRIRTLTPEEYRAVYEKEEQARKKGLKSRGIYDYERLGHYGAVAARS